MALLNPHWQDEGIHQVAYTTPLLSEVQYQSVNNLVGQAAFDKILKKRLLENRDESLCVEFGITTETWSHLKAIDTMDLSEFCRRIRDLYKTGVNHY